MHQMCSVQVHYLFIFFTKQQANIAMNTQADEAREHCKSCQVDVKEKRVDLANTKSEIITQIREMVSQCDLTLKAVSSDGCLAV